MGTAPVVKDILRMWEGCCALFGAWHLLALILIDMYEENMILVIIIQYLLRSKLFIQVYSWAQTLIEYAYSAREIYGCILKC